MPAENDGIRNIRQVLWRSVDSLATGSGVIKDRLLSPAMFLIGLGPGLNSLADEERRELEAITRSLTAGRNIEETLKIITDNEAVALANRIIGLYIKLRGGI